ncbi:hypothetical protein ACHWQZ_G002263 [Mnemiopsis leidyi]
MALSRDDVRKHLEELGYFNVSDDLLDVFAKDLNQFVLNQSSINSSSSSVPSHDASGLSDVTNTSSRKRITKHRNGNTSVSIREAPSYLDDTIDTGKMRLRESTFDFSDSISTISISTVDENKPFPRKVWDENERLPACIIPRPQTSLKSDPLKAYKKYEASWNQHSVPGQKRHTALRNAIKRQMMECDLAPFVPPQREVSVNRYEVPTSKKRERLRWAVRNQMMS